MTEQEILAKVEEVRVKREAAIAACAVADQKQRDADSAATDASNAVSELHVAQKELTDVVTPYPESIGPYQFHRRRGGA